MILTILFINDTIFVTSIRGIFYMKKLLSLLLCISALTAALPAYADDTSQTTSESEVSVTETVATDETDAVADEDETTDDTDTVADEDETAVEPDDSATPTPTATTTPINPELAATQLTVTAQIEKMPFIKESDVTLELFTLDDKSLGTAAMHVTPDTQTVVFTFSVPEFEIGQHFKLKAVDGLDSVLYYEDRYFTGNEIAFPTYAYTNENGELIKSTDISVTVRPLYEKSINIYYNGSWVNVDGARVIDGTAMVPIRALGEFIGFNVRYDSDYNTEVVSLGGNDMYFNVGTAYTTVFGTDLFTPYPTTMIDGAVYVSLRTFTDAIGSNLEVKDYFTHMDINISESSYVTEYFQNLPINKMNVSSRTNYMVWVSLSEYKVRLYEGKTNQWTPLLEATCAIGAPGTPTITGSFEYQYKARWDYGTYYVGPCLVFHGGYALHSVLLYQNNTEYDGRVGVKISHGCIRLKKKDIDFIANTIPVGTRIYITP